LKREGLRKTPLTGPAKYALSQIEVVVLDGMGGTDLFRRFKILSVVPEQNRHTWKSWMDGGMEGIWDGLPAVPDPGFDELKHAASSQIIPAI
jgi:hypothetical protein